MLKNTFEWLRVVEPTNDETVPKRVQAVEDLLTYIRDGDDLHRLVACTVAARQGFRRDSPAMATMAQTTIDTIRQHSPAFPHDIGENELILRICCALALGEILISREEDQVPLFSQVGASLFLAAIGLQAPTKQKHFQMVLGELKIAAVAALDEAAVQTRQQTALDLGYLEQNPTSGDVNAVLTELRTELGKTLRQIDHRLAVYREEPEALWWLTNSFSEQRGVPMTDLPVGIAAVYCGVELAGKVLLPPPLSAGQILNRILTNNRPVAEMKPMPLKGLVDQWDEKAYLTLLAYPSPEDQLILNFPEVFPISWLAVRLHDSQGKADWTKEFETKTGVKATHTESPIVLANQVFNERVALSMLLKANEG